MNTIELEKVQTVEEEIMALYQETIGFAAKTVKNVVRIGELLMQEKERLPHGDYLPWLKNNFPFSEDTAERWCQLYARREEIPWAQINTLTQAYQFIKKTKKLTLTADEEELLERKRQQQAHNANERKL